MSAPEPGPQARQKLLLLIHGLGGDGRKTWRRGERPGLVELIQQDKSLNAQYDVAFFKYPTSLFKLPFFGKIPKIQDLADGLRTQIDAQHRDYSSIVLVCHSLGGLIARQYLINEVKDGRPLRVTKLALFAVPNNGAGLASIGKYISWKHNQLTQLCRDSDLIEFLNEDWFRLKIGELLSIKYVVAGLDRAVDAQSAKSYWGNPDIETVIDKGHVDLVKPERADNLAFMILKNLVDERRTRDAAVDLSHAQAEWIGFRQVAARKLPGPVRLIEGSLLANRGIIDRASTLILALPYRTQFTEAEASYVKRWVENGGGLLLLGYYAADTHHGGNPSRLAREFGFEFEDTLVMPEGASEADCRRQVYAQEERLAVRVDLLSDASRHPILQGISRLAFLSSCSIRTDWGTAPEWVVKSPPTSDVWYPDGPKGPEGWSRQVIERWVPTRKDAAPLLVAFKYGSGRVVLAGTWKLCTFDFGDNIKLFDAVLEWLAGTDPSA